MLTDIIRHADPIAEDKLPPYHAAIPGLTNPCASATSAPQRRRMPGGQLKSPAALARPSRARPADPSADEAREQGQRRRRDLCHARDAVLASSSSAGRPRASPISASAIAACARELAKRAGVTVKAVRHYEAIGLLPAAHRTGSGYRYFRQDDVAWLRTITALKSMGFGLREIRDVVALVHQACCPEVRPRLWSAVGAKLGEVEHRIQDLVHLRAVLLRYRDGVTEGSGAATERCSPVTCTCLEGEGGRDAVSIERGAASTA